MTLDRVKTVSDIVAAWFGLLAITAGGIFAVVQYLEKEHDDRVKSSLDMLARFHDPRISAAYDRILSTWRRHEDELTARAGAPVEELNHFVLEVVDNGKLNDDLITVTDFYETVQICVAERICDRKTALALFRNDAQRFYRLHYAVFERIRTKRPDPGFGAHLEALASTT